MNEPKHNLAFNEVLVFALVNFSSHTVTVSISKQGVSSFYENQLKWQWQKLMLKAQFLPHYEKLHNGNRCPVTVRTAHKNLLPNPRFTPYFTLHCSTEGDGHLSCFPERLVDCQQVEDEVKLLPSTETSPRCHRFHLSYKSLAERGRRSFLPPLVHLARCALYCPSFLSKDWERKSWKVNTLNHPTTSAAECKLTQPKFCSS